MFLSDAYSGPGRKDKLSGGMIVFIVFVLMIQGMIILYALFLAVKMRVRVVWLDPYLQIDIQGADGYAVTEPVFDKESFRSNFEKSLLDASSDLDQKQAMEICKETADAIQFEFYVKKADGQRSAGSGEQESEEEDALPDNLQEELNLPTPGLSNGDTVTVYADVSEEAWSKLRDQDFYFAFECQPVALTVSGLPEAAPYDPFADLTVSFSGLDGAGTAGLYYNGNYPLSFSVEPSQGLHNGDTVEVHVVLEEGYDLDSFVEDYHIMPSSLSQQYSVSGLYVNPTGIQDFSGESRDYLMQKGREAANALLTDEYNDDERFVLDDEGMYFAVSQGTSESGTENYLFCIFLVNFSNEAGEELAYYYYVRFEDLMLDDQGNVIADFEKVDSAQKPSIPLIGEALGGGSEVSVPGILSFRTLVGYETIDQLISRVITPLETAYSVTSIEQ